MKEKGVKLIYNQGGGAKGRGGVLGVGVGVEVKREAVPLPTPCVTRPLKTFQSLAAQPTVALAMINDSIPPSLTLLINVHLKMCSF